MRVHPATLVQHAQPHRRWLRRLRFGVTDRRSHDLQKRQRQRHASPSEKRAPRDLIYVAVHLIGLLCEYRTYLDGMQIADSSNIADDELGNFLNEFLCQYGI